MTDKTDGKSAKKKKSGSQRVNVDLAPKIIAVLDAYLERENNAPDTTKSTLTYTDVVNHALEEFLADFANER